MAKEKKEFPEIQLDDNFKVTYESQNWTLYRYEDTLDVKTKKHTGNFKWKRVGHFGENFEQAIKRYTRESVNDSAIEKIDDVLDKLKEIDRKIDRVVKIGNVRSVVKDNE